MDNDNTTEQQRSAEQSLLAAVRARDASAVLGALLSASTVNINVQDEDHEHKFSPLHWAAHNSDLDSLQILLDNQHGVNLESLDCHGDTPLQVAVLKGSKQCVKALMDRGADLETKENKEKRTPLLRVCTKQDVDMALLLIDRGACINAKDLGGATPLHLACWFGDHPLLVETLLAKGADPDANTDLLSTALHFAASSGSVDCMRVLLKSGLELEAKNAFGSTALLVSVARNRLEAVRFLLDYGAAKDTKNSYGFTPLHYVAAGDRPTAAESVAVAEELLRRGANMFERTKINNRTPFDEAVATNQPALYQCILDHYLEKFAETHGSLSLHALFEEAKYVEVGERKMVDLCVGQLTIQQMLVSLQFLLLQDPNMICAQDIHRSTPLHVLCKDAGDAPIELVRWLVEQHLLSMQASDGAGRLPLHVASHARAPVATLQYLVNRGGVEKLRARDHDGALPLHLLLTGFASATAAANNNNNNAPSSPPPNASSEDDANDVESEDTTATLTQEDESLLDAVKYLVTMHSRSAEIRNDDEEIPLMMACHSSAPADVLFVLLKTFPDLAAYLKTYYTDP